MKIRAVVPILAALLMTPAVWAQAAAPAGTKVGVINVQAAIASTAEGKQAAAELQSQFAPRTTELQNLQKQIEDLRNRLQTGQSTLSDEEKARLQREGDQLTRAFQRKQQEFQDDTNDAQQDVVNRIGRKLVDVLDKYAKENSYSVILDDSSQQTPVLFAANPIDVTQDIIRLYDQSYPVKTGTTAAPKPAPRPAPGTAAPKP
jgi:outer membrane protein